jgi:hypothetical protein
MSEKQAMTQFLEVHQLGKCFNTGIKIYYEFMLIYLGKLFLEEGTKKCSVIVYDLQVCVSLVAKPDVQHQ